MTASTENALHEEKQAKIPRAFISRRLHSLLGLWLVLYLFEHLLVNSQAGLFFDDDGSGFISMVNKIHNLPYLRVIEVVFLAIPFLFHGLWGISYLRSAKYNSHRTDGSSPALPQYKRNKAYTWQRITSWVLLVGILLHVVHMRFLHYPQAVHRGMEKSYLAPLQKDASLYGIAHKLGATVFTTEDLQIMQNQLVQEKNRLQTLNKEDPAYSILSDRIQEDQEWLEVATKKHLKNGEVLLVAPNAGTAFLLILRETFKSPLMVILYTILVLAASFHAFNGLWTFLITWGITIKRNAQNASKKLSLFLMALVTLLGLVAIWGTFFSTLWIET